MSHRPRTSKQHGNKAILPAIRNLEIEIDSLGARGDGIGRRDGGQVFVPATAPGDRVVVKVEGRRADGLAASVVQILVAGPGRVVPPCRYFGVCGGCAVQHLDNQTYSTWKRNLLVEALGRVGFAEHLVAPIHSIPPGNRRRAAFAFSRRHKETIIGFNSRASHRVVDLEECLLLAPPLVALLPLLRQALDQVLPDHAEGDAIATLTESGIDLLIEAESRLDLFDRERLANFAQTADLARLSWRRPGSDLVEPIAGRRPAIARFAGIAVEPPPGGFLQPSLEGERVLAALVFDAVGDAHPNADLFCGCGTFTLPIAQKAHVHAVEGDALSVRALKAAVDHSGIRVTTEVRDLAQRPLLAHELARFRAVVFDPPRAGAQAQAQQLAAAGPAVVVAVSCNPATLARDARILASGGYSLIRATPVDQFPWSSHLETVAVFQK